MSSRAIQIIAVFLGVIAIILVVFVWRLSRSFAENAAAAQKPVATQEQTPTVPQILVVIATSPLASNVPIKKDDVALVPVTVAPTEYFANVEDVIGRTPLIDLDKGQPVTPRFFKDSNIIARGIPPGQRALSLRVDDVVGVGGFIRPGDTVDVLVYIKSSTDTPTGDRTKKDDIATQARILLKDVTVLAYEDHLVEPPKGIDEKDKNKAAQQQRRERTAVFAVPEDQVTRVLLGASLGEVRLALHGSQTPEALAAAETPPDTAGAAATPAAAEKPGLPLTEEAKAKAKAKALAPPDQVITATDLAKITATRGSKRAVAAPPSIEVYRGSKLERAYP